VISNSFSQRQQVNVIK